jgi:hypothetical protein
VAIDPPVAGLGSREDPGHPHRQVALAGLWQGDEADGGVGARGEVDLRRDRPLGGEDADADDQVGGHPAQAGPSTGGAVCSSNTPPACSARRAASSTVWTRSTVAPAGTGRMASSWIIAPAFSTRQIVRPDGTQLGRSKAISDLPGRRV